MRDFDLWNEGPQRRLEPRKPLRRCRLLSRLVILAAIEHEVEVLMRFEPVVPVRIARIPEKSIRKRVFLDRTRNHVGRVERELRLEQCGARESLVSNQWVV